VFVLALVAPFDIVGSCELRLFVGRSRSQENTISGWNFIIWYSTADPSKSKARRIQTQKRRRYRQLCISIQLQIQFAPPPPSGILDFRSIGRRNSVVFPGSAVASSGVFFDYSVHHSTRRDAKLAAISPLEPCCWTTWQASLSCSTNQLCVFNNQSSCCCCCMLF
jgi:hypothetical protein